nr:MAG TPA: hypothetical protein [Caudoviricetes sp.]
MFLLLKLKRTITIKYNCDDTLTNSKRCNIIVL